MKLPILMGAAKRKLTPLEARFILDALTLDYELRRAAGYKRRTRGFHAKLAKKFKVSRNTIMKISRRRSWRSLRLANLYDISKAHRDRARDHDA